MMNFFNSIGIKAGRADKKNKRLPDIHILDNTKNIKAYIIGLNKKFFVNQFKNKIQYNYYKKLFESMTAVPFCPLGSVDEADRFLR